MIRLPRHLTALSFLLCAVTLTAQDRRLSSQALSSSPFPAPKANDYTYVVDEGTGLDTGCTFRSGGPLRISLPIQRVLGDKAKLQSAGRIPTMVRVEFPAYDVDSSANIAGIPPERDRVSVNGHVVAGEFLTGLDNTWVMQRFDIPVDWLNFPSDPGAGNQVTPASNEVRIDIDTLSGTDENWCTAVDWVAVTMDNPIPPRPWIGAHGIFSDSSIWNVLWVPNITALGIPAAPGPDMGRLDSIGNNAAKIGAAVTAAQRRWGVDRVNIFAHSKGGLDSRDYIENTKTVDKLVQLGTPNAGSPLADTVQSQSTRLFSSILGPIGGVGANIAANLLAGGVGGYQLTTPYMAVYNSMHGRNPKVSYLSIGGVQTPGGWFSDPIGNLLETIVGSGDLIVPLSSVHALPYAAHDTVTSTYPPTFGPASHTGIHQNQAAFNKALPLIVGAGFQSQSRANARPSSFPALATAGPYAVGASTVQRSETFGNRITQGQTDTYTVPVDQASTLAFALMYADGDFDLTLRDPSGLIYDPAQVPNSANVSHQKMAIPGGYIETWAFTGVIVTGNWTATVTARTTTGPTDYALNMWTIDAPVTLTVSLDRLSAPVGTPFTITARVVNGTLPVAGATVNAYVLLPDGTTSQTIALVDDGTNGDAVANDGVYTGKLSSTTQSGAYKLSVDAHGTAAGAGPFSREAFLTGYVSLSNSSLLPGIKDVGRDLNGNGLYDQLVLQIPVKILANGTYRFAATLRDSAGKQIEVSNAYALTTSSTSVELAFDGSTLFANGTDGPYQITSIRMAEQPGEILLPLTETTTTYTTASYKYTAFEGGGLALTGTGTAVGVDTNSNGKFDRLDVTLGVNVLTAGAYQWSARLRDRNGKEIALASGSGNLSAGTTSIQLSFSGSAIGANGVDGPYQVTDLLLFNSGTSLSVANALTTQAFSASAFEGYAPVTVLTTTADVALFNTYSAFTLNANSLATQTRSLTLSASTGALAYTSSVTGTPVFVTVAPASGTTPANITLTVNPGSLAPGTYTNTVNFSSGTATVAYTVSLTIQSATAGAGLAGSPSKVGVYRAAAGLLLLDRNGDGACCAGDTIGTLGQAGDIPLAGDWSGSGLKRFGLYRPSTGLFLLDLNSSATFDSGDKALFFAAQPGDVPVTGDWTGTGVDRVGVFRNGTWYLDVNGDGSFSGRAYLGQTGDIPLVGNWSGVGKAGRVGIYRPNSVNGQPGNFFLVDFNGDGLYTAADPPLFLLGQSGDVPIVGDWNGDGKTKVGIFRPAGSTGANPGLFILDQNGNFSWDGPAVDKAQFFAPYLNGLTTTTTIQAGDVPITGNWVPSYGAQNTVNVQGRTRTGIYRPATGTFFLDVSADGTFQGRAYLGQAGDVPVGVPLINGSTVTGVMTLGNY